MERKIGEEFSFNGYRLKVEKATNADCNGCFFFEHDIACQHKEILSVTGPCDSDSYKKAVIFTEIHA